MTSWWPLAAAAAVTGVIGAIVRPVLVHVAAAIGWWAVALATLFGQAIVMQIAFTRRSRRHRGFVLGCLRGCLDRGCVRHPAGLDRERGTDESFAAALLRTKPGVISDPEVDGVLFIQLDGASFPVMNWALNSGSMPTLRRWLRAGTHEFHEWLVQLPCTTPASQQAILMGTTDGVPGLPLVRPRARPRGRRQPARRRRHHRVPGKHGPWLACRRWRLHLEPVHR